VAVRLRLVHPMPTRNITAVYRRGPARTTNAPDSGGQAIAVRYQTRRKPAAATSGKCHIFATRAALPAPKALSPSQVGVAWPLAAACDSVTAHLDSRRKAGFITSLRDNALIALGRAYAQINAAMLAALTAQRLSQASDDKAEL
jgi:hypothetical protein